MAGVEDPVQDGLADDRVGEQRVPVGRGPVAGQDQRPAGAAGPLGQQLIQVVGLGGGELPHREVVADEHGGLGELADAGLEAAVGVPAGQVGQQPGAGGEGDVVAAAAGLVAEGGGQVGLAYPDRPVGDDPLPGFDELQPGQVADLGGGQRGVVAEVELFQGGAGREPGGADPPGD